MRISSGKLSSLRIRCRATSVWWISPTKDTVSVCYVASLPELDKSSRGSESDATRSERTVALHASVIAVD